jgi:hypothetical protein
MPKIGGAIAATNDRLKPGSILGGFSAFFKRRILLGFSSLSAPTNLPFVTA